MRKSVILSVTALFASLLKIRQRTSFVGQVQNLKYFYSPLRTRFLLLSALPLLMPTVASADNLWDAIQVTCSKDLDYFALRTIALEDINYPGKIMLTPDSEEHLKQSGIYYVSNILKQPYTCQLPKRSITVKVDNYQEANEKGECGSSENFSIVVLVNGNEADRFRAYGANRCTDPENHLIELDQFNHFWNCTLHNSTADPESPSLCKRTKLVHQ